MEVRIKRDKHTSEINKTNATRAGRKYAEEKVKNKAVTAVSSEGTVKAVEAGKEYLNNDENKE